MGSVASVQPEARASVARSFKGSMEGFPHASQCEIVGEHGKWVFRGYDSATDEVSVQRGPGYVNQAVRTFPKGMLKKCKK